MLPQLQAIKETSVAFTINKKLQVCVGIVRGFKRIDAVGTSISRGSAYDMVLNPTIDGFYAITCGGWNLRGENRI